MKPCGSSEEVALEIKMYKTKSLADEIRTLELTSMHRRRDNDGDGVGGRLASHMSRSIGDMAGRQAARVQPQVVCKKTQLSRLGDSWHAVIGHGFLFEHGGTGSV
jgi:hypothetical protein